MGEAFQVREATAKDVSMILAFIKELAAYEKLLHEVTATEEILEETLFGEKPNAKVVIGYLANVPVTFALYFHNFSTFLGRPGIYLEDLFVKPEVRGKGIGKKMLAYLAHLAKKLNCGRLEWWVLNWNKDAIEFYKRIGTDPMNEWTVHRVTGEALNNLAQTWIEE